MNSQSFPSMQRPHFSEDQDDTSQPPQPARRAGPLRSLWEGWVWLSGPRPERFGSGIVGQERLRRSRLISALLIVDAVVFILLAVGALASPLLWTPVLITIGLGLLAALLNRAGQSTLAGLAFIALVDANLVEFMLSQPHGLTVGSLIDFDLMVLAVFIGGMILPRQLIFITGALHIAAIIIIFQTVPHDPVLNDEIRLHDGGQPYVALLGSILLQFCGTCIVWLFAWSVDRAIRRADRAEELAEARARINEQARQIAEQKQRLEHGIQVIQEVQARVANGEYSARVSLQGNELLPLGISFNLLAERLGRVERIEQEYQRLEHALHLLLDACERLARGAAPASLRATGTLVDRISPFLLRLAHLNSLLHQGSALAEDLRAVLERQIEHLSLAETRLISSLSLANDLAIETVQTLHPPTRERKSGPLDTQSQSDTSASPPRISRLLDQQIALLEQVKKYDEQARDLGARCMQGARILSQRLKETG
jgi:hypothetical protein